MKHLSLDPPTAVSSLGLYDDPAIYDVLYTPGTAAEVDGLERIARRLLGHSRLHWLEPACGTGRYLRVLAARRHHVTGFDTSAAMLDYARTRLRSSAAGRRVRLLRADMQDFAAQVGNRTIDIAFNPVNTLRHLESDAAMLRHLADMARVLRPGGIYAIGISLSSYGNEPPEEDIWDARRGGCTVRQIVQYLPPGTWNGPGAGSRIERVVSHLVVERPAGREHRDTTYALRCYDARQWQHLLARSPLRWEGLADSAGRPLASRTTPYAIDILRRH